MKYNVCEYNNVLALQAKLKKCPEENKLFVSWLNLFLRAGLLHFRNITKQTHPEQKKNQSLSRDILSIACANNIYNIYILVNNHRYNRD